MGGLLDTCCVKEKFSLQGDNTRSQEKNRANEIEKILMDKMNIETEINSVGSQEDNTVKAYNQISINSSNIVLAKLGLPSDYYEKLELLGEGAFGIVFKVKLKGTNEIRALKVISKNKLDDSLSISEIEKEVMILKRIDHPNIVKVFETFSDEDNFYIVYELCSEGTLLEKLEKLQFSINETLVKRLMSQILSAVAYLHSQNIIHGDLKLENIMIDSLLTRHSSFTTSVLKDLRENSNDFSKFKNSREFEVKLIDFGCSKIFSKRNKHFIDTIGTIFYLAPEVIKNNYTAKCDVWSCGVIMYLLLCGQYPFYSDSDEEVQAKILSGKLSFDYKEFEKVSKPAKDLVKYLLTYDQEQRPTAEMALRHHFFTMRRSQNSFIFVNDESKIILSNLKNLSGNGKFREAVLTYITHNFTKKDEVYRLKNYFKYIDKNGDGRISRWEMLSAYKELGLNLDAMELDRMLEIMDADNSGFIEYQEFIRATISKEKILTEENLKLAFDQFDLDKNGSISCGEIKNILSCGKNLTDGVFEDLLKELGKKADDEIGFQEFKKIICSV